MDKNEKENGGSFLGLVSSAGVSLIPTTLVGFLIGYHLDKFFGTQPWLLILFILLGLIAGYRRLIRIANYIAKEEGE